MKVPQVLVLAGPDLFQPQLYLDDLRRELFPKGSGGLNDDTFDAKEKSLAEIFDLANTLPMLGSRRLIVLRNAESAREADQEKWLRYLENSSPQTVLIGIARKLDKRTRLYKALDKHRAILRLEEPKPREIPGWIDRLALRHEITLEPAARRALAEALGTNLGAIDQDLQKLKLYVWPEKTIKEEAISHLVLESGGEDLFGWTDRVVEGKLAEATEILDRLLNGGKPALVLASLLARHLRILFKARHHVRVGTARPRLPQALGVPPFVIGKYLEQARRFSEEALQKSIGEMVRLDQDLKSTGHPAQLLMERSVRVIGGQLT